MASIGRALRDKLFVVGEIMQVEQVAPRMRRITIGGPAIAGLTWTPGQHVRVLVGRGVLLRTYSVWHLDPTWETLDLIGYDHGGDAPGAAWVRTARVGDQVSFTRPDGKLVVRQAAPYHLFIGEETASVAFGAMLRALRPTAQTFGVVEAEGSDDHLALPRPLTRVSRRGPHTTPSTPLIEAVSDLPLPDAPGIAYLAGEARTIQAIRTHLVKDRNWPRRFVLAKPFWTPGRRGLD
ncbi:siderophore-interacting protein [Nonomuraea sediminis]|uniref:siderophore-interacting protein n=1 Tax=Nonomuraea sediminis TaxID=2835864 RepID=UPI001BDD2649|nr:siderophore-interacting protein [Nonomuraea sediminis]